MGKHGFAAAANALHKACLHSTALGAECASYLRGSSEAVSGEVAQLQAATTTTKRMARLRQIRVVFFLLGICYRLRNPAGDRSQSAGIYAHDKACVPDQPTSATADSTVLLRGMSTMDSTESPDGATPDPTS